MPDPFILRKSDELVQFFKDKPNIGYAFSVDVEDLYYSVPQHELLASVKACIQQNAEISFQNTAGISSDNFLTLLDTYLNSTFILFEEQLFFAKGGSLHWLLRSANFMRYFFVPGRPRTARRF